MIGESARLDLDPDVVEEEEEDDSADSAVLDEEVLDRIDAGREGAVDSAVGRTPAAFVTAEALSMYFSMRRSLFHFM